MYKEARNVMSNQCNIEIFERHNFNIQNSGICDNLLIRVVILRQYIVVNGNRVVFSVKPYFYNLPPRNINCVLQLNSYSIYLQTINLRTDTICIKVEKYWESNICRCICKNLK